MENLVQDERVLRLKRAIRDIPDFPKPGILFKDITPLLKNSSYFRDLIDLFCLRYKYQSISKIVGIESRGFIIASAMAYQLGLGLIPVRKKGKLPWKTHRAQYGLEYGQDTLEIHQDALEQGEKVLIVDDVLATGGTVAATSELVQQLNAIVLEVTCLIELTFLNGRDKLKPINVFSLIQF